MLKKNHTSEVKGDESPIPIPYFRSVNTLGSSV